MRLLITRAGALWLATSTLNGFLPNVLGGPILLLLIATHSFVVDLAPFEVESMLKTESKCVLDMENSPWMSSRSWEYRHVFVML